MDEALMLSLLTFLVGMVGISFAFGVSSLLGRL